MNCIKRLLSAVIIVLALCFSNAFANDAKAQEYIKATKELIERVTPGYSSQIELEIIPADNGEDVYEISSVNGKVLLKGNNPVSLATAYNQYLKYTCNAHLSWFGDQLNLPKSLPSPKEQIRQVIQGKYRPYMNYCTLSYTASWWNWERWQREIDFMAMNSINMPLFMTGLEAVWYNTLLKFGFSDEEARTFLVAPSHFGWQWMQNIEKVGGPLPKSWIDSHIKLGQQIIKRELELGMVPIQQGFSGYVPRALKEKFPDAKIAFQGPWCAFPGAAQLDPMDPLFAKLGKAFLEEEAKLFGSHGYYAADPFHESKPPVKGDEYLEQVGKAIHQLFKSHDKNATWVMQAWSMYKPILTSVPMDDIIVLDLDGNRAPKNQYFWGYRFVTGQLHNFGGRINMHGDLRLLASTPYNRLKQEGKNIIGSGLFMEGIEQNPVFYDLAFELPCHSSKINLTTWLNQYATRRYGHESKQAQEAWQLLLDGPYKKGTNGTERSSIICARPALNPKKSGPNQPLGIPYSPQIVIDAQSKLLADADILKASKPYRFDIVDVQRQIMTNLGQAIHKAAAEAFVAGDKENFKLHSDRFLQMLRDVDELLRTRTEFNFDKWITDARSWGTTEEEKNQYERAATALVTIWGEGTIGKGDPFIFDYSWREWTGLIEGYYLPRWQQFYQMLQSHLDTGTEYTEEGIRNTHGRPAFRANEFLSRLGDRELQYVKTYNKARTPITVGDEVELAKRFFKKYSEMAKEYYKDPNAAKEGPKPAGPAYENLGETPQA